MISVKCFGSITSDFRKYFESRKYYDIFVIISQIQTIPNFGNHSELSESLGNFRNHSEISEFFYTWRAIRFAAMLLKKLHVFVIVSSFLKRKNLVHTALVTMQACFQSLPAPCRIGNVWWKFARWIQKSATAFPVGGCASDKRILKIDKGKDGDGFITSYCYTFRT